MMVEEWESGRWRSGDGDNGGGDGDGCGTLLPH